MKLKSLSACILAAMAAGSFISAVNAAEVNFSGYARYGALYNTGDEGDTDLVDAANGTMGRGVGRLGNENNGGEFQLTSKFEGANGTKWDVAVMAENWWADNEAPWVYDADDDSVSQDGEYSPEYGNLSLKKFYAKATNVFAAQPDMMLWAGRDFHQRPQTGLSDYFWMTHDGQGGGFENMDLGGAKFNLSFVAQANGDSYANDTGQYAITSKLHGIKFSESVGLDIYANYGFADDTDDDNTDDTAFQVAGQLNVYGHKLTIRYANDCKDTVYNISDGSDALLAVLEGGFTFNPQFKMDYQVGYQNVDNGSDIDDYSAIIRPMMAWDDIHSTWLEAGLEYTQADDYQDSNAWKVTLSQNVSIDVWGRPMLRFYTTVGETDNDSSIGGDSDTWTLGAMFEAWW